MNFRYFENSYFVYTKKLRKNFKLDCDILISIIYSKKSSEFQHDGVRTPSYLLLRKNPYKSEPGKEQNWCLG